MVGVVIREEVRPEYLRKLKRLEKHEGIRYKSIEELRAHIERCANLDSKRLKKR